ncbi:MAG: hypothetical protein ACP5D6_06370 [Kosmotogaceae bacterium]
MAVREIWVLENSREIVACQWINQLYSWAKEGDEGAKETILMLYDDDDWETIQERMETEGSVWYVWYMDGVRKMIHLSAEQEKK